MAFHIKNPDTDRLARKVAALRKIGLTEAVHTALRNELDREAAKLSLVEAGMKLQREVLARSRPGKGLPADKAFIDSLYEGE